VKNFTKLPNTTMKTRKTVKIVLFVVRP